jgi:sugar lactone lactonase YvrE
MDTSSFIRRCLLGAALLSAGAAAAQPRKPLPAKAPVRRAAPAKRAPAKVAPKPAAAPGISYKAVAAKSTVPVRGQRPQSVASFPDQRVTGVAVSSQGRVFVNFPYWEDGHGPAVMEVVAGLGSRPYPDAAWNKLPTPDLSPDAAARQFVCVQSVVVDDQDRLWVLDPASPKFVGVVPGGAKLVQFDLATNAPARTIVFDAVAAPTKSYLNDVRFDTRRNVAYLTDSGLGALLVLDLKTGRARRVLEGHPSTQPEPDFSLVVNGKELRDQAGQKPDFRADGLELSADGNTLYYQALMGRTLYRIGTEFLRDSTLTAAALAARVQKVGTPGAADGFGRDAAGNIYLSGIENNTIRRLLPSGQVEVVAQGPEISWPDSFASGPGNTLYFTTSQIQTQPKWNKGKDTRTRFFGLWKLDLKAK